MKPSDPPLEGGSKNADAFFGEGYVEKAVHEALMGLASQKPMSVYIFRLHDIPLPEIRAALRRQFRPSLKGRVEATPSLA
ncbi:hypothetical protein GCM10008941_05580 [Rhizomicrobium palustre]